MTMNLALDCFIANDHRLHLHTPGHYEYSYDVDDLEA